MMALSLPEEAEEAIDGRAKIGDELEVGGVRKEGILGEKAALRGRVGDLREIKKAAREGGVERKREGRQSMQKPGHQTRRQRR